MQIEQSEPSGISYWRRLESIINHSQSAFPVLCGTEHRIHSRKLSMLRLLSEEDNEEFIATPLSQGNGRLWKRNGQALSLSSCALSGNIVAAQVQPCRIKNTPRQKEESPRPLQCSARGRVPRSWWLKGLPLFDGTLWRKKSKEQILGLEVEAIDHSGDSFHRIQSECLSLKQERERLLARLEENEIETEMYTSRLTTILENNNIELKHASESLKKMESVITYLQSVILAKDLEIQFLKRSSDNTTSTTNSDPSTPSTGPTYISHDSHDDEDTEFMLSSTTSG